MFNANAERWIFIGIAGRVLRVVTWPCAESCRDCAGEIISRLPPRARCRYTYPRSCQPIVHEPGPPSCAGVRVLVVEDDEDARYILGGVLTYAGAVVRTAASAREAVMALDGRDDVDVIVTDYSVPGDTGLRLLAHARDRPRPVPLIALTGYAGMQVKELDGCPFARARQTHRPVAAVPRGQGRGRWGVTGGLTARDRPAISPH